MKKLIIAVNISKSLRNIPNPTKQQIEAAAKDSWKLNIKKCQGVKYLIAVDKGEIKGTFEIIEPPTPAQIINRVHFELKEIKIERLIADNLKHFVTKYI